MLRQGVIASLPAVEALFAEEACAVVGVLGGRVEVESCFGELGKCQQNQQRFRAVSNALHWQE